MQAFPCTQNQLKGLDEMKFHEAESLTDFEDTLRTILAGVIPEKVDVVMGLVTQMVTSWAHIVLEQARVETRQELIAAQALAETQVLKDAAIFTDKVLAAAANDMEEGKYEGFEAKVANDLLPLLLASILRPSGKGGSEEKDSPSSS